MAKYGSAYGGNSTKSGFPPCSDEWSKPSYASESDHLSQQPLIVDAEGRKMPIILETSNHCAQRYVAEVETAVEQVPALLIIEYRYSSPPKVMPMKDYGHRHSVLPMLEQTKDNGYKVNPVKDYGYTHGAQTKDELVKGYGYESEPMKDYGYKHSSPPKDEPVKGYGYKNSFPAKVEPMKNYGYKAEPQPVKDYEYKPEPVKEYVYKVEPIKDCEYKPEPLKDYGYMPELVKDYGYKSEPVKGHEYKPEPVKDYARKPELVKDYKYKTTEPVKECEYKPVDYRYKIEPLKNYGYKVEPEKEYGRVEPIKDNKYVDEKRHRPSSPVDDHRQEVENFIAKVHTEASQPKRFSPLIATNERQLAQSDKQNSNPPRFTVPAAIPKPVPKRDTYTEIIDSREAERRYGNLISQPQTIDSREAARKYGGVFIGDSRGAARKYSGVLIGGSDKPKSDQPRNIS